MEHKGEAIFDISFMIWSHAENMRKILGTSVGPILKPKPKLVNSFGRYRYQYRNHIKGRIYLVLVWGVFSITKGPLKPYLLPNYFWRSGFIFKVLKTHPQERSGKHEKNLKLKVLVLEEKVSAPKLIPKLDFGFGSWSWDLVFVIHYWKPFRI